MARLVTMLFGYLALMLGCAAQQATPSPVQQTESRPAHEGGGVQGQGRITGTVYCTDTNKPARGTRVLLGSAGETGLRAEVTAIADMEGRFVFDHLKPGDYSIRATLNGYLVAAPTQPASPPEGASAPSAPPPTLTVHSTETIRYDIRFSRAASLSGRVFFEDGAPAMGVSLRIEHVHAKPPGPTQAGGPSYVVIPRSGERGQTDDRGSFRITTLPAGIYRVAAVPHFQQDDLPFDLVEGDTELRYPAALAIFSGDTMHRATAKTYVVHEGDEVTGIEITIPLTGLHHVHGTVGAADGRTVNMGMVKLVDQTDTEIHYRTAIRKDGTFDFIGVPSGTYKLSLSHVFLAGPDTRDRDSQEDDAEIPTNAFADANTTVIVMDSDVIDLHFDLAEIPMPPKKLD